MDEVIIDSAMSFEEGLAGTSCPDNIRDTLCLVDVQYVSFDEKIHQGQLIIEKNLEHEVLDIFRKILEVRFPIQHAKLPVIYGWDDDTSMRENNTSAFNYRIIHGTDRLSNHSFGSAIDINPALNPYIRRDGSVMPEEAQYDETRPGTLVGGDPVVALFKSYGWDWGGDWERKDWQHFSKIQK